MLDILLQTVYYIGSILRCCTARSRLHCAHVLFSVLRKVGYSSPLREKIIGTFSISRSKHIHFGGILLLFSEGPPTFVLESHASTRDSRLFDRSLQKIRYKYINWIRYPKVKWKQAGETMKTCWTTVYIVRSAVISPSNCSGIHINWWTNQVASLIRA